MLCRSAEVLTCWSGVQECRSADVEYRSADVRTCSGAAVQQCAVQRGASVPAAFPTLARGLSVIAGKVNGPERLPSIEQDRCLFRSRYSDQPAARLTREARATCEPWPHPSPIGQALQVRPTPDLAAARVRRG